MTRLVRLRALALAAATVVALAGCTGGGSDDTAFDDEGVTGPPPTAAPPATTPAAGDVETFEFVSQKNPFTPLAGDQAGTAGTPGPGTGTGTDGTGTPVTGTDGAGTGTPATGGVEPEVAQRVALLDVFTEDGEVKANVRINSTVHEVGVGDTFADRYKVLSLSAGDECGRFLFGDDAFRLCKGEQTTK